MPRRPPISTLHDSRFSYPTLFRSEQLVLDDRATERRAASPLPAVAVPVIAVVVLANHVLGVLERVVHRAVEVIGARLGNGIDVGTHTPPGGDIVVRGGNVVFLDRKIGRASRRERVRQYV